GQMATALARGLVDAQFCRAGQIVASDPSSEARERFAAAVEGVAFEDSSCRAVEGAEIVLLAVKPRQVKCVAEAIRTAVTPRQLLVSIAAGIGIEKLRQWLGMDRVVRVMPNTPCLVRMGCSAYSLGPGATAADADLVERMMAGVGVVLRVEESYMDAVTGLSGSGPAYVYLLIEALADGGVRVGLPRPAALKLAAQTVRGAAEMVVSDGQHPALLKDRVTSPGGTTIAGLQVLEDRGVRGAAMAAVQAATQRAREMREAD
ncbi:MAG: pyrroline-5-carboxylate reductase, partial [Planctomycetota bacterium]